jgi:hypothetical protein
MRAAREHHRIPDLAILRELLRSGVPQNYVVELDLPNCSSDISRQLEQAIRDLQSACGCREGAIALLLTVCGAVVYFGFSQRHVERMAELGITALFGILASFLGKAAGLIYARAKANRLIDELLRKPGALGSRPSVGR